MPRPCAVESHARQPKRNQLRKLTIPPTAVGGWFRSCLQESCTETHKSHQRQLVDGSSPTYRKHALQKLTIPPTAVGGWFKSGLQRRRTAKRRIPPTAVGGSFRSCL